MARSSTTTNNFHIKSNHQTPNTQHKTYQLPKYHIMSRLDQINNVDSGIPRTNSPYDYHTVKDDKIARTNSPYDYHTVNDAEVSPITKNTPEIAISSTSAPLLADPAPTVSTCQSFHLLTSLTIPSTTIPSDRLFLSSPPVKQTARVHLATTSSAVMSRNIFGTVSIAWLWMRRPVSTIHGDSLVHRILEW